MDFTVESGREVLRRTPEALRTMLVDLPDEWIHGREVAGAWSVTRCRKIAWGRDSNFNRETGIARRTPVLGPVMYATPSLGRRRAWVQVQRAHNIAVSTEVR